MADHQVIINSRVYKLIPLGFCACGCGEKTAISKLSSRKRNIVRGRPKKFISGHNSKNPSTHPNWKGGNSLFGKNHEYKMVYSPGHPRSCKNHILEHILIAEKALGKPLPPKAVIHHHAPEKIVICQNQAYHLFLHQKARALKACGHANWRKCCFCKTWDELNNLKIVQSRAYHADCFNFYQRKRKANKKEAI